MRGECFEGTGMQTLSASLCGRAHDVPLAYSDLPEIPHVVDSFCAEAATHVAPGRSMCADVHAAAEYMPWPNA